MGGYIGTSTYETIPQLPSAALYFAVRVGLALPHYHVIGIFNGVSNYSYHYTLVVNAEKAVDELAMWKDLTPNQRLDDPRYRRQISRARDDARRANPLIDGFWLDVHDHTYTAFTHEWPHAPITRAPTTVASQSSIDRRAHLHSTDSSSTAGHIIATICDYYEKGVIHCWLLPSHVLHDAARISIANRRPYPSDANGSVAKVAESGNGTTPIHLTS